MAQHGGFSVGPLDFAMITTVAPEFSSDLGIKNDINQTWACFL